MQDCRISLGILVLCLIQGLSLKSVDLSPSQAYVDINKTFTFNCTYNGYEKVLGTKWNIDNKHTPSIVRHPDGACIGGGLFANTTIYRVECPSDITFSVTILRVLSEDHDVSWNCFDRDRKSNTVIMHVNGISLHSVTLLPTTVEVIENSSVVLTCSFTGEYSAWNRDDNPVWSYVYIDNDGICQATVFLNNSLFFTWKCHRNGSFSLTMFNVDRRQHEQVWTCRQGLSMKSNAVVISVEVPAWKVVTHHKGEAMYMRENQEQVIICNTSACRPTPTVKWYVQNSKETITYDMTEYSTQVYIQEEYGLVATESRLEFSPNRTINNWNLFCEVWTRSNISDIKSKEIVLNVSYPPKGYPVINGFTYDKVHRVFESELITLNCSVTGGNPLPTLTLTCVNKSSANVVILNTTVIAYITWKATRYENRCMCESQHVINGKQITFATFEVMFPPTELHFNISGTEQVKETFVVNQNEVVTFLCITESNPSSDIILKNNEDEQLAQLKNTTILAHTILKVSCIDAREYTCSARNIVTRGQGVMFSLILIVKCLPMPSAEHVLLSNITGSLYSYATLEFFAHNYFDEHKRTQFTWYKQNIPLQHSSRKYAISSNGLHTILVITNISETDYGHYKVVVKNSVGQYIHYYTLHKTEHDTSVQSSNTGTIIGVAVGTFAFTLLLTALCFIGYNCIRRNRILQHERTRVSENLSDNQANSAYDGVDVNNDKTTVYEQLDDTSKGGQSYMEIQSISIVETNRDYINTTV